MEQHSFSLSSIGMTKGRAQVKLDGEDISDAVSGVGLDFSAREHPRVMLELTGVSADVAVDSAEIQLPTATITLLQRLGWKSPEWADEARAALRAHHVPSSDETASLADGGEVDESDLLINLSNRLLAEVRTEWTDMPERVDYAATQLREHLAALGTQNPGAPLITPEGP